MLSIVNFFFLFKVEHHNESRLKDEINVLQVELAVIAILPVIPAVISGKFWFDIIL